MGSGRAYTKSGSIQKYESSQWSTPTWSSSSAKGTVSTPDSDGNYTVSAPSGYKESTTGGTVTCTTHYGGVAKVFYFTQTVINMTFNVILFQDYYGPNSTQGGGDGLKCAFTSWSGPIPCDILITVGIKIPNGYGYESGNIIYFNYVLNKGISDINEVKKINYNKCTIYSAISEPSSYKDSDGTTYNFNIKISTI